jgi:3-hydroxy-2-methylpyridine-4,5-dicarboxylate 4-decarboxylase
VSRVAASPAVRRAVEELIWAGRILAHEGVLDAFGHVSVRHPENPGRFLQTTARAAEVGGPEDVLEIELDGTVVTPGDRRPFSERVLHGMTYAARPDVMAVCHHHAEAVIPFSVTGIPLRPLTHLGAMFWQGVPVYDAYDVSEGMLVTSQAEGRRVARCLGDRRAILMRGHGALVVGEDVPRMVMACIYLVREARLQLDSLRLGHEVRFLSEDEAREAGEKMLARGPQERAWEYWKNRVPEHLRPRFPW